MAATPRVLEIRLSFFFVKCLGTLEVSRDNIRMCTHKALYLSNPIWLQLKLTKRRPKCGAHPVARTFWPGGSSFFGWRFLNEMRTDRLKKAVEHLSGRNSAQNLLIWPTNLDRKRSFWSSLSQFQKRIFSRPKCPRERVLMCPIRRFRKVLSVSKKKPRHVSKYRGLTIYTT